MKLTLLENANDFLNEALNNALKAETEPVRWKYAILNLAQSIELSLKEKLRREHEILIYENIDYPKDTIGASKTLKRLKVICNIDLSSQDIKFIKTATELRNFIIHSEFSLEEKASKINFAHLLGFLHHFYQQHLDIPLDTIIHGKLWREALSVMDFSEKLFKSAEKIIEEENISSDMIWMCPYCNCEAFVIQDKINSCYVCGFEDEVIKCYDCKCYFMRGCCTEVQIEDGSFQYVCHDCHATREENYYLDSRYYDEMYSQWKDEKP